VLLTRIRLGRTRSDAVLAGRRAESTRTPTTAASAASEIAVLWKKMIILFNMLFDHINCIETVTGDSLFLYALVYACDI